MGPNRKLFGGLFGMLLALSLGTACLADAIDDTQRQIENDKKTLRDYQQQLIKYEDAKDKLREARPEVVERFNEAKVGIKAKDLASMLKDPSTELYVLNTWLNREQAMQSQTERYIASIKGRIARQQAVVQQEQQSFDSAIASAARNQSLQNQAETQVADQQRLNSAAQYWNTKSNAPQYVPADPQVVLGVGFLQNGSDPKGSQEFSNWNLKDPKNAAIWDSKKMKDQSKGGGDFSDLFQMLNNR